MANWTLLIGEGDHLSSLQMSVRALIIFIATLALMRLSGRRSMGQHNAFDICLTVLIGAVLSRAVVGASPFSATIASAAVLVILHRCIAWASVRWSQVDRLVNGEIRALVVSGKRQDHEMKRGLISERDLAEAARKKSDSVESVEIQWAVLERDGHVSVGLKSQAENGK